MAIKRFVKVVVVTVETIDDIWIEESEDEIPIILDSVLLDRKQESRTILVTEYHD